MTKINRPDTLLTTLRDLERRLRLLEAARMRPSALTVAAQQAVPVPFLPARPADWPGTGSSGWERLSLARAAIGAVVELHLAADPDTAGAARVLVDGEPVGDPMPVTAAPSTRTIAVPAGSEIAVEARRDDGAGLVRVAAFLQEANLSAIG